MTTTQNSSTPERDQTGLRATSCQACGMVSTPVQQFGCESCGADGDALTAIALTGRGQLLAAVTVHQAPAPPVPSPYAVGVVQLEEGPVIRALLRDSTDVPAQGAALVGSIDVIDGTEFVVFSLEESDR